MTAWRWSNWSNNESKLQFVQDSGFSLWSCNTCHCHLVVGPDVLKPLHSSEISRTSFPIGQKTTTIKLGCSLILLFLLIDCEYFWNSAQLCDSCICMIFSVNIILVYSTWVLQNSCIKKNQLEAELFFSMFRQPLRVLGINSSIIRMGLDSNLFRTTDSLLKSIISTNCCTCTAVHQVGFSLHNYI